MRAFLLACEIEKEKKGESEAGKGKRGGEMRSAAAEHTSSPL